MLPDSSIPDAREVKEYLERRFGQEDAFLHKIRTSNQAQGLPEIHIPIHLGRLLYLLVKIQSPSKILEIGTLGGYSTAWLLRGLRGCL